MPNQIFLLQIYCTHQQKRLKRLTAAGLHLCLLIKSRLRVLPPPVDQWNSVK